MLSIKFEVRSTEDYESRRAPRWKWILKSSNVRARTSSRKQQSNSSIKQRRSSISRTQVLHLRKARYITQKEESHGQKIQAKEVVSQSEDRFDTSTCRPVQ